MASHQYTEVPVSNEDEATGKEQSGEGASQSGGTTCSVYLLTAVASVGGFLFGYDTGVVSGAMIEIKRPGSGLAGRALTSGEQELIVSSTVAAAALGSYMSGILQRSRHMGRKGAIMHASVWFTFGAVLMAVATSVNILLIGRVLVGVAVGVASHTVPLYIAETSPAQMRGTLTTLNNVMVVIGQVVSSIVCCFYAQLDLLSRGLQGWRWMLGLGAVPSLLLLTGMSVLPESPRWLLHVTGDSDKALAALDWLRASREDAELELREISATIDTDEGRNHDTSSLFQKLCAPRTCKALQLGISLQLLQQFTAINTIMYYSATILEMAKGGTSTSSCSRRLLHDSQSLTAEDVSDVCWTAPIAFSQAVGNFLSMCIVDSLGRKPLMLSSLLLVGISLFVLGAAFHTEQGNGSMAIGGMCVYLITFGIGLAPLPWVVNAEIYPLETRGAAIGITTATNWISNFVVAATFLDLVRVLSTNRECPENHPDGAFWLYGTIAFIGIAWLAWSMPETQGKTLEAMDSVFQ